MTDKQKLLEYLDRYSNPYTTFEDIVTGFIGVYASEFSAYRLNRLTRQINDKLVEAIDKMEVATRVAHERATYLKCYLEGKMYENEEVARQCVGLQIENAKAILDSTEKVAL